MTTSCVSTKLHHELHSLIQNFRLSLLTQHKNDLKESEDSKEDATAAHASYTATLRGIFQEEDTVFVQYEKLLVWCEDLSASSFSQVRAEFLERHKAFFKALLEKSDKQMKEFKSPLIDTFHDIPGQSKNIISRLDHLVYERTNEVLALSNCVSHFEFLLMVEIPKDWDHQKKLLNNILEKIEKEKLNAAEEVKFEPEKTIGFPSPINLLEKRKQGFLHQLDCQVQGYREKIRSPYFIVNLVGQFFMFFSPTRWRRKAALADYKNTVSSQQGSTDAKYAAATTWLDKQWDDNEFKNTNASSRFFTDCVLSAREDRKLMEFESMGYPVVKSQKELNDQIQANAVLITSHNDNVQRLNAILDKLTKNRNALQTAVNAFLEKMEVFREIKDIPVQASVPNVLYIDFYKTVRNEKMKAMCDANRQVLNDMPALKASSLLRILLDHKGSFSKEKEKAYHNSLMDLRNDPDALQVIDTEVDKLIAETKTYAQMENPNFVGLRLVKRNLRIIGMNETQHGQFKEANAIIEKNKGQLLEKLEMELVALLKKQINTGTFPDQLTNWAKATKHCIDSKKTGWWPDADEEALRNRALDTQRNVKYYYKNGGKYLGPFFRSIMYPQPGIPSAFTREDFKTTQQLSMFVQVYGSPEENVLWDKQSKERVSRKVLEREAIFKPSPSKDKSQDKTGTPSKLRKVLGDAANKMSRVFLGT